MAQDQQRLTPAERANLVAYLDGELPEGEARVIATKLSQSATARREAEQLERTWDLLAHLPRPDPPQDLTERTLTEVRKLHTEGEKFESALTNLGGRFLRLAGWATAILVSFGIGSAITLYVWPNPTVRLVRDLSIAEHLDEYRDVGDFTFLKRLADLKEFGEEPDDRPAKGRQE